MADVVNLTIEVDSSAKQQAIRSIDDIKASVEDLLSTMRALDSDKNYKGTEFEKIIANQLKAEQQLLAMAEAKQKAEKQATQVQKEKITAAVAAAKIEEGIAARRKQAEEDRVRAAQNAIKFGWVRSQEEQKAFQQTVDTSKDALAVEQAIQKAKDITAQKARLVISEEAGLYESLSFIGRQQFIKELASQFALVADETKDSETAVRQLNAALLKVGATTPELNLAGKTYSTARAVQSEALGGSRRFLQAGSQIINRAFPTFGTPFALAGDLVELFKDAPKIRSVLADINKQFGLVGKLGVGVIGAFIGFQVGIELVRKSLEGVSTGLQEAASRNLTYYKATLGNETSAQIQERLVSAQQELAIAQAHYTDIQLAQANAFKAAQEKYGDAGARSLLAVDSVFLKLGEDLTKADDNLGTLRGTVDGLTDALKSSNVAMRDAAERAKQYKELMDTAFDQVVSDRMTIIDLIQGGSVEDARNKMREIQTEMRVLQQERARFSSISGSGFLSDEKLSEIDARYLELEQTYNRIQYRLGDIQKAERAQQAGEVLAKAQEVSADFLALRAEYLGDELQMAIEARKALQGLSADYKSDFDKMLAGYNDDISKINQDYQDDSLKESEDYATKKLDIEAKANDNQQKAEAAHQARLLKIENAYQTESASAVQDRNAVAFDAAKTKRDEALKEAQSDYDAAAKERKKDTEEQLKELALNFDKQAKERQRDYERKLSEARAQYARESAERYAQYINDREALSRKIADEKYQRYLAYTQEISDLRAYLLNREGLEQGYWGKSLAYVTSIVNQLSGIMQGGSNVPYAGKKMYTPTEFHTGGSVSRSGIAIVQRGEVVLTRQQQQRLGGGLVFAPTINGMSRTQVRGEVIRQLDLFLDEVETA